MSAIFRCSYCKNSFPKESFYKCKSRSTGVTAGCKNCSKKLIREWEKKNKERVKVRTQEYRKKRPQKYDDWHRENREYLNKYMIEWRKKTGKKARRKGETRELRFMPDWANTFFIKEIYDLARRRSAATGSPWEVDHVIPLNGVTVNGLHVEGNLRVIHRFLNRSKRNTVPKEL